MGNQCLEAKSKESNSLDNYLVIKIITWNKDAHHLFDYSSDQLKKEQKIIIQENGLMIKYQKQFKIITDYSDFKKIDRNLIQFVVYISKYDHHFQILNAYPNDDGLGLNNFWQVISKDAYTNLEVNDIFKLGRIRFKVVQIVLQERQKEVQSQNKEKFQQKQSENQCKLCYNKTTSNINPLISPCGCIGSLQYIHLNCLRLWISNSKETLIMQNSNKIPFIMLDKKCQLCGKNFKLNQIYEGNQFDFSSNQYTLTPPYIQLHVFFKKKKLPKIIYYFSFKKLSSVQIGRGSTAGIRILNDISISRQHALLHYKNGKIFLTDYKSKFGTLKLMNQILKIQDTKTLPNQYIQMNNHLFSIETKPRYGRPNYQQRKRTEAQILRILNEQKQFKAQIENSSDVSEEFMMFEQDQV